MAQLSDKGKGIDGSRASDISRALEWRSNGVIPVRRPFILFLVATCAMGGMAGVAYGQASEEKPPSSVKVDKKKTPQGPVTIGKKLVPEELKQANSPSVDLQAEPDSQSLDSRIEALQKEIRNLSTKIENANAWGVPQS